MGPSVHPVLPLDGSATPLTRQPRLPIGIEANAEIARFSIDVLVLLIKASSPSLTSISQDDPDMLQELFSLWVRQRGGWLVIVDLG